MLNYEEMFDYYKAERAKLLVAFENLPTEEFTRNRELSFYSIKDVFLHTIDVEDKWLHYRYRGLEEKEFKPSEYVHLIEIKEHASVVDRKTSQLFQRLTSDDLNKEVIRKYPDGRQTTYTLQQVLYHIPIEVIHHYGEIFAEFWKMNLEAPYLSYLGYSKNKLQKNLLSEQS